MGGFEAWIKVSSSGLENKGDKGALIECIGCHKDASAV